MDGSAAGATPPAPRRAAGHGLQSRSRHTLNRWAQNGSRRGRTNGGPAKASGDKGREWRAGYGSYSRLGLARLRHPRRLGVCLLKNTYNLGLQFREFRAQHDAARVQDQVEALGQQLHMAADRLAHAALDAIAFMRLAQHLAGREPNTRTGYSFGLRRQE